MVLESVYTHHITIANFSHKRDTIELELRRDAHNWLLQAGVNRIQHTADLNLNKSQLPKTPWE